MRVFASLILILSLPLAAVAGPIDRVDISPSVLVNMASGHSGAFMGGALTGDIFFSKAFGLRTTIGYTKSRYYPSELDYRNAQSDFWLSFAPYAQLNIGRTMRPYLAILGTITTGNTPQYSPLPLRTETTPFARVRQAQQQYSGYSFGATIGSKFSVLGPISLFGEVSHYFYSRLSGPDVVFGPDLYIFYRGLDFERNPTYLSFGITYTLDLKKN